MLLIHYSLYMYTQLLLCCFILIEFRMIGAVSLIMYEPQHQKSNNLNMRKQRRRSAMR